MVCSARVTSTSALVLQQHSNYTSLLVSTVKSAFYLLSRVIGHMSMVRTQIYKQFIEKNLLVCTCLSAFTPSYSSKTIRKTKYAQADNAHRLLGSNRVSTRCRACRSRDTRGAVPRAQRSIPGSEYSIMLLLGVERTVRAGEAVQSFISIGSPPCLRLFSA